MHSVIAVDKNGIRYYDHNLTHIEKGKLLDQIEKGQAVEIDGFGATPGTKPTTNPGRKIQNLISLLQINGKENARRIKLATGWERGADGKWRYEEPDGKLIDNGELEERRDSDGEAFYTGTLGDIWDSKELYGANPELKDLPVMVQQGDGTYAHERRGGRGSLAEDTEDVARQEQILLREGGAKDARPVWEQPDANQPLQRRSQGRLTDAEVSLENDSISKVWGKSRFTPKQQKALAERERLKKAIAAWEEIGKVQGKRKTAQIEAEVAQQEEQQRQQAANGQPAVGTVDINTVPEMHNESAEEFDRGAKGVTAEGRLLGQQLGEMMKAAGMKVVMDGEKMRQEYEKSLPIAVVRQYSKELSPRDIGLDPASFAAKLQKISERLNAIAEKRADSTDWHGVISELADALGANGGASKYVDIRIDNNHSVSLRISNHNANADNYGARGRHEGNISIVFKSRKSGNRFHANEDVELTEYVYTHEVISQDGNILSGVARSLARMLTTGEYVDQTGKALVNRSPSALQGVKSAKEFLRTREGEVYGFVKGDTVYLDPELMNPNTPLHEYTHLWARAVKVADPEFWARSKELMKELPLWEEVLKDEAYADIAGDEDLVGSEVLARLTGENGAAILDKMVEEAKRKGDAIDVAKAVTLRERVRSWLKDFCGWVRDAFSGKWDKKELDKLSVNELWRMPLRDFAKGMNPVAEMRRRGAEAGGELLFRRGDNSRTGAGETKLERTDDGGLKKIANFAAKEIVEKIKDAFWEGTTTEDRLAAVEYLQETEEGRDVIDRLYRHRGTDWAKAAANSVMVRIALEDLLAGREPKVASMLTNPGNKG